MKIMGMGINYSTSDLLIQPVDELAFGAAIWEALTQNAEQLRNVTRATTLGGTFRSEVERKVIDLGDPRLAGWTFLVNSNDPQKDKIIEILRPLAERRGMLNPDTPLYFNGELPDEWVDWLSENYSSLSMGQKPRYILIVGDPAQVPFLFQAILSTTASVGRVDFDSLQDLQIYTEKIIRLETAVSPAVEREAIFFAPDYGTSDPTYYSRHYMVEPLADDIQNRIAVKTRLIAGRDATKERLQETLRRAKPALVYSASHGLGAPDESFETQKRVNGAICCQRSGRESSIKDWLFMADDVPHDVPFLEGAVVFQFACFGYGTPAESDFAHWDPRIQKVNASADFIAALPKALLAHPHGPVNFIGHVDVALLHGFDDPENPVPALGERWHPRIEPFRNAVDQLLNAQPSGQAMADMSGRYNIHNAQLTGVLDRIQRKKQQQTPDLQVRLASAFMSRSDAQNYMIFGDPAVHLRIPTE